MPIPSDQSGLRVSMASFPHQCRYISCGNKLLRILLQILHLRLAMETLERTALEGKLEQITTSNVDPAQLALKLQQAGIIDNAEAERSCSEDRCASERLGDIVLAVMKNDKEGVFQMFVSILCETELKELGKELKGMT